MPMFHNSAPKSISSVRASVNASKLVNYKRPIDIIGHSGIFSYGYDGYKYYVTEGVFPSILTTARLSLDKAKALFDACTLATAPHGYGFGLDPKAVTASVKEARRKKLTGDDLLWHFVDLLES